MVKVIKEPCWPCPDTGWVDELEGVYSGPCLDCKPKEFQFIDRMIGVLIRKLESPEVTELRKKNNNNNFPNILLATDIPELYEKLEYIAKCYGLDFKSWDKYGSSPRYKGIFWLSEKPNEELCFIQDGCEGSFTTWLPVS